jgi:hypothetical protein
VLRFENLNLISAAVMVENSFISPHVECGCLARYLNMVKPLNVSTSELLGHCCCNPGYNIPRSRPLVCHSSDATTCKVGVLTSAS